MSKPKMVTFPQGSVILKEGDMYTDMYKIIKGHAELYVGYKTPTESLLGVIGAQTCFGEFGLLLGRPAIYTVIAYDDMLALRITTNDLADFVRDNHKNIIDIMKNMAESMTSMRFQIDLLLKEIEGGKKADEEALKEKMRQARQTMRQYAVYNAHVNKNSNSLGPVNK